MRRNKLDDMLVYQRGMITIENWRLIQKNIMEDAELGLQTAPDGRIWLCVNGQSLLRFKPHRSKGTQ